MTVPETCPAKSVFACTLRTPPAYRGDFRRCARMLFIPLFFVLLPACKLVITVPYGGKVVSEDGFECLAGQTCEIEVTDDTFDSTFRAVPDKGYTFTRWRSRSAGLCGNATGPCYLSTTSFGDNAGLMNLLASDAEFFVEPVFVQYKLGYWQKVLEEIAEGSFASDGFLYVLRPDIVNCDPGALTAPARKRALQALNHTRGLHQLPAVELRGSYDMQVQEASLVQKANNYLNHNPAPGDACYTAGAKEGASTSNLSGASAQSDPANDIFGWTNDNNNIAQLMEAGHRRWILDPQLAYTSYGQVQGFSALKVFGFSLPAAAAPTPLDFVAMPYQSYPYKLVDKGASPTPWSFSMIPPQGVPGDFNYFQNTTVSVVERDSGKPLNVRDLHRDSKGFGLANFLSWMVSGWDYDIPYTVKVRGISMPGGDVRNIEYTVLLDRYNLFNVRHPLEAGDKVNGKNLRGNFDTASDADSYRVLLSGARTLAGQSDFSNQGFFILVYDDNKRLVASSDAAFNRKFAFGNYTIIASQCDEDGLCYQGVKAYQVIVN